MRFLIDRAVPDAAVARFREISEVAAQRLAQWGQLVPGARLVESPQAQAQAQAQVEAGSAEAGPVERSGVDGRGYAYRSSPAGWRRIRSMGVAATALTARAEPGVFTVVVGLNAGGRPVLSRRGEEIDATPDAVRAFVLRHASAAGGSRVRVVSSEGTGSRLLDQLTERINQQLEATVGRSPGAAARGAVLSLSPVARAAVARLTASGEFAGWSVGRIDDSPLCSVAATLPCRCPVWCRRTDCRGGRWIRETGAVTGSWRRTSHGESWLVRQLGGASSPSDVDVAGQAEVLGTATAHDQDLLRRRHAGAPTWPCVRRQRHWQ